MLKLLEDIATDINEPIGPGNPLRQVIVNTHSPSVVSLVPDDSLLIATLKEAGAKGQRYKRVSFSGLPDTWRQLAPEAGHPVSRGELNVYLNPIIYFGQNVVTEKRRVMDRSDLQFMLPGFDGSE
jgi:hypothetical protein